MLWDGTVTAFLALLRKTMQPGDEIVMLPVQSTYPGGQVKVKGTIVPVSGTAQLQPSQVVPVLIRRGVPHLAFAHSARRAQPGGILPRVDVFPLVEHLFRATNGELYVRNHDRAWPLGLASFGLPGTTVNSVHWGPRGDRFLIDTRAGATQRWISVFRFNRARGPEAPYRAEEDPAENLVLERTHALHTDPTVLVAFDASGARTIGGGLITTPETVTIGSAVAGGGGTYSTGAVHTARLDDAGHIILFCVAAIAVRGQAIDRPDGNSGPLIDFNLGYAIIHDITRGIRYLDSHSGLGPAWPIVQTATDGIPWTAIPVTYEPLAGGGWCARSVDATTQRYFVPDFLVTHDRLQSWIGTMRREFAALLLGIGTCPGVPGIFFAFVDAPPTTSETESLRITLLNGTTDDGIYYGLTDGHLVWKRVGVFPPQQVDLATGAMANLGPGDAAVLNERSLRFLRPDWTFQPDLGSPVPEAEQNIFLALWDAASGAAVAPSIEAAEEDDGMEGLGALAPLPEGVTVVGSVQSWHVLNDERTLQRRQRYRDTV